MPVKARTRRWIAGLGGFAAIVIGCSLYAVYSGWLASGGNQGASDHATSKAAMPVLNQAPQPMRVVRHGQQVRIDMYAEETKVAIDSGVTFPAWTFDGTVPGPVLYLHQGDHVTLTLHNLDPRMSHSIDLHAANAGPNEFAAFHVVGTVLRDVQASGNPDNHLYDVQTYTLAPGDGALVHLRFDQPGTYTSVSHSMSAAGKGAMGGFKVTR